MTIDSANNGILYVDGSATSHLYDDGASKPPTRSSALVKSGTVVRLSDLIAGKIDEVQLYNRALNAEEVRQLMPRQRSHPCPLDFEESWVTDMA